jgi:CBS domain containing-hemolysin-like protein
MVLFLTILLLLLLILLNGFFVTAEYSLVTLRKTRVDALIRRRNKTARAIQHAQENLNRFISATQLGVTITSLAVGWLGEPAVADLFEPSLHFLPEHGAFITAHTIAVILGFIFVTFVHVVIGELVPKAFALQRTETAALFTVKPLTMFTIFFKPFIWFLDKTNGILLRLFGLSAINEGPTLHSEEEVQMILAQSGQGGIIPQDEVAMANNVFILGDTPINHIMLPRTDIIALEDTMTMEKVMQIVMDKPHSRFPIYKNTVDDIVGYVHIKDIYRSYMRKKTPKMLKNLSEIREILTVPGNKLANDVLLDMQRYRKHMAVVADEFGGTEGIVTLEDIIESLVGEIYDEFEKPQKSIRKQADGTFLVDGRTTIKEVQAAFQLPIRGHAYTTIGGLVFGLLGREAITGDKVQISQTSFEVTKTDGSRVTQVRIRKALK